MIVTVSSYKIILHALQMKTVLKMSRYWGWKYHISYQQNTLLRKVVALYKFVNIWIKNYKVR